MPVLVERPSAFIVDMQKNKLEVLKTYLSAVSLAVERSIEGVDREFHLVRLEKTKVLIEDLKTWFRKRNIHLEVDHERSSHSAIVN